MRAEDFYYFKLLLSFGLSEEYDEWLNNSLESEAQLSDIVLQLSLCGSDKNKTISVLHHYCEKTEIDERIVCDKLRGFLKEEYHSKRLDKEQTVLYMYKFATAHSAINDLNIDIWGDMIYMDDYYQLAKDGTILWENFDNVFLNYLNDGIAIDSNLLWHPKTKQKSTILSRFKKFLKK